MQVSLTVSPIQDDAGRVIGASKVARDITERKRAEAERKRLEDDLRKLAADLSEADHRKNEFLATLVARAAQPARADAQHARDPASAAAATGDVSAGALETMDRQLGQLVRLVDDLLDLNRITHNRIELRRSEIELRLGGATRRSQASGRWSKPHGHDTARSSSAHEPILLDADPVRLTPDLRQPAQQRLQVHDARAARSVRPRGEQRGAEAVVTVRTTGSGIPPDTLEQHLRDVHAGRARRSSRRRAGSASASRW